MKASLLHVYTFYWYFVVEELFHALAPVPVYPSVPGIQYCLYDTEQYGML